MIAREDVLLLKTSAGDRAGQARNEFPHVQDPPATIIVPEEGKPGSETTYKPGTHQR